MSDKVREWLIALNLFAQTTHEDRKEIDREIEKRTGVWCDDAVTRGLISEQQLRDIVTIILLRKKKKKKEVVPMVV